MYRVDVRCVVLLFLYVTGERKSPYIALCCVAMALSILFFSWHCQSGSRLSIWVKVVLCNGAGGNWVSWRSRSLLVRSQNKPCFIVYNSLKDI